MPALQVGEGMRPPYLDDGDVRLYLGDCIEVMAEMDAESVDAVVCDPPYGLEFMGKDWDSFAPVDLDRGGRWTKDERGAPGTVDNSNKRTPHGRTGVSFGASRTFTSECDGCGKRDAFRAEHGCCGGWRRVPVDDGPPPRMVAFAAWCETWAREALRVLKPGGHLLAFGGTRTFHRLTCGIEDAGFEVRDCLSWLYGSGFPKSLDVSKAIDRAAGGPPITAPATDAAREWQGWGTALKPAWEPCVVARKPLAGTVAENVQRYGTGALNVDGCRIPHASDADLAQHAAGVAAIKARGGSMANSCKNSSDLSGANDVQTGGRWPANVVLDEQAAAMLDAQSGVQRDGVAMRRNLPPGGASRGVVQIAAATQRGPDVGYGGQGGASRFFYTAKASRADRSTNGANNTHPTVKPTDLMRWLVRLVTPPGGVVLDPFAGSGSTLVAARAEGVRCIGIEREAEYAEIIAARLSQLSLFSDGAE